MSLAARRSDRSTKAALTRVGTTCTARAREEAARGANARPHELRKRCKELRGLLRLLKPGLPEYSRLNTLARDAARAVAPARDAEVMLKTFDTITARLRAPQRFAGLRARLVDEIARCNIRDGDAALASYIEAMRAIETAFAQLALDDKASRILWKGLGDTWKRARHRHAQAQASLAGDFDPEVFHDWRKVVKQHWYQARFLARIRKGKLKRHIARIDALAETLGAHNDLDTLMVFLDAQQDLSATELQALEQLRKHLLAERRKLAREALTQADKALALPPKALAGQWRRWWRAWLGKQS